MVRAKAHIYSKTVPKNGECDFTMLEAKKTAPRKGFRISNGSDRDFDRADRSSGAAGCVGPRERNENGNDKKQKT